MRCFVAVFLLCFLVLSIERNKNILLADEIFDLKNASSQAIVPLYTVMLRSSVLLISEFLFPVSEVRQS